jgi:hypothetical protein
MSCKEIGQLKSTWKAIVFPSRSSPSSTYRPLDVAVMVGRLSHILGFLASTRLLVSASPAAAPASGLTSRDLHDLTVYGLPVGTDPRTFAKRSNLQRRGRDQNHFHSALPSCSSDDDPSYAVGQSAYTDGEGTLITPRSVCDNGIYKNSWHCWYVYTE